LWAKSTTIDRLRRQLWNNVPENKEDYSEKLVENSALLKN